MGEEGGHGHGTVSTRVHADTVRGRETRDKAKGGLKSRTALTPKVLYLPTR